MSKAICRICYFSRNLIDGKPLSIRTNIWFLILTQTLLPSSDRFLPKESSSVLRTQTYTHVHHSSSHGTVERNINFDDLFEREMGSMLSKVLLHRENANGLSGVLTPGDIGVTTI